MQECASAIGYLVTGGVVIAIVCGIVVGCALSDLIKRRA